jgi:hypothetical protein
MEKNEDDACYAALINLIKSHKAVESWTAHKGTNTLVIVLKEELGVYDLEIFNQFLSQSNQCKDLFESDAKFEYDKQDYTTIFIKLKKQINMKQRFMRIILFLPCCVFDGAYLFLIGLPMFLVCGTNIASRESSVEWLVENTK